MSLIFRSWRKFSICFLMKLESNENSRCSAREAGKKLSGRGVQRELWTKLKTWTSASQKYFKTHNMVDMDSAYQMLTKKRSVLYFFINLAAFLCY